MIDKVGQVELVKIAKLKGYSEAQIKKMSYDELSALISNSGIKNTGTIYKGFDFLNPISTAKTGFNGNIWGASSTGNNKMVANDFNFGINKTATQSQLQTRQQSAPLIITDEQAKDFSIDEISQNTQSAFNLFSAQEQNQGITSKAYDGVKNKLNTDLSSNNVNKAIDNEVTGLNYLTKAKDNQLTKREYYEDNKQRLLEMLPDYDKLTDQQKENVQRRASSLPIESIKDYQHRITMLPKKDAPEYKEATSAFFSDFKFDTQTQTFEKGGVEGQEIKAKTKVSEPNRQMDSDELITFEEVYKNERGVSYNKENIENFEEKKIALNFAAGATQKYESLNKATAELLKDYQQQSMPIITGEVPISQPEPNSKEREDKVINLYQNYFNGDNDKAKAYLQDIAKENKMNVNVNTTEDGKLAIQYGDEYKNDYQKNKALNTLLSSGVNKQETKLNEVLNGKTYEQYKNEYAQSYTNAYGSRNAEELAKAYKEDQESINAKAAGAVQIAGASTMVVGGVVCLIPGAQPAGAGMVSVGSKIAIGGMVAKTGLDVVNESTRKGGMTNDAAKAIIKEAAINTGCFAIGVGAGMTGAKVGTNLLANGSSKFASVVAERGVDFTVSILGDMAMLGDVNLKGNTLGAVTSTLVGLKAGKSISKNAEIVKDKPSIENLAQTKMPYKKAVPVESNREIIKSKNVSQEIKNDFDAVKLGSQSSLDPNYVDNGKSIKIVSGDDSKKQPEPLNYDCIKSLAIKNNGEITSGVLTKAYEAGTLSKIQLYEIIGEYNVSGKDVAYFVEKKIKLTEFDNEKILDRRYNNLKKGQLERGAVPEAVEDRLAEQEFKRISEAEDGKEMVIVTGKVGSGKSTIIEKYLGLDKTHYLADADLIKPKLPGYKENGAGYVHRVSTEINEDAIKVALEQGKKIVHSTTGWHGYVDDLITWAKNKGYSVRLIHSDIDTNVSIDRVFTREAATEREVDPLAIKRSSYCDKIIDKFKNDQRLDQIDIYDNNGSKPLLKNRIYVITK